MALFSGSGWFGPVGSATTPAPRPRAAREASGSGVTTVTESFNYGTAKLPAALTLTGYDKKNGDGISETLKRLAARFA